MVLNILYCMNLVRQANLFTAKDEARWLTQVNLLKITLLADSIASRLPADRRLPACLPACIHPNFHHKNYLRNKMVRINMKLIFPRDRI